MIDPTSVFDRPIAFQRGFVSLGCGITGALMLSQAVYWSKRTSDPDGWFYKTAKEWEEETGLTRCEQETARARLNNIGALQEKKQGVPCKLYYRVDFKVLLQLCGFAESSMRETSKLDVSKPAYKSAGIRQSSTEITTETTTENKDIVHSDESTALNDSFELFWKSGMKKLNKKKALSAFKTAFKSAKPKLKTKNKENEFAAYLVRDVQKRIKNKQFGFDRLHPVTYLNGERWHDEYTNAEGKTVRTKSDFPEQQGADRPIHVKEIRDNKFVHGELTQEHKAANEKMRAGIQELMKGMQQ